VLIWLATEQQAGSKEELHQESLAEKLVILEGMLDNHLPH
jgi:hypothetical protein